MQTDKLSIHDVPGGTVIAVKVVPGSSRDRIVGPLGDALKIATSCPPEKGKANAAVAAILASALGLRKGDVELVSSPSNPHKEFRLAGLSAGAVRAALEKVV